MYHHVPSGTTITAATGATLTVVNYATDKVQEEVIVVSQSILEYAFVIFSSGNLELTLNMRDILFFVTAMITVIFTIKAHADNVKGKRRRKTDPCKEKQND